MKIKKCHMLRVSLVLCICMYALLGAEAKELQLKDVVLNKYAADAAPDMVSLADGVHYLLAVENNTKIVKCDFKTGNVVATVFDVNTARECKIKKFDGFVLSNDERKLMIHANSNKLFRRSFSADYFVFDISHNVMKPVSAKGGERIATLSPDGRMVAFVRDNNVYIKKLDYDSEVAVTKDGEANKIINGATDWVYEEEFSVTNTLQWSPDNGVLAYMRFDESKVLQYSLPIYGGKSPEYKEYSLYPGSVNIKYPVAGETNSSVKVMCYDVETRVSKEMPIPLNADGYIPRIAFSPNPARLMVCTLNRNQNDFIIYGVNPRSTVCTQIYRDQEKTWINEIVYDQIHWYPDFFVIASEKSGFCQLYQYGYNGSQMRQITTGKEIVTDYYGYDAITRDFYYQATENGALNRGVYRVNVKGIATLLSEKKGYNSAWFNDNMTYSVIQYSDTNTLPSYTLYNVKSGKPMRVLEDNSMVKDALEGIAIPKKEFFTFDNGYGETLNGYIIKPTNFDASKKYPVLMSQYSGPGSQQVLNKWQLDFEQCFAQDGYIICCVDGRGTGARGKAFESQVYMHLGKYETEDQLAAAQYMSRQSYVDKNKIAIYGWSYGGYESLMSASAPNNIYAAAVAVAPVTNWRYYDTIYSERFMRSPQENDEGYKESSPMQRTKNIRCKLLIVTGTADDNVHPSNTYELTSQLVADDIIFDMMVYTNKNHFINGSNTRYHLYKKIESFLNQM